MADEEAEEQHKQAYMEWLQDLGEAAISQMNPVRNVHTIESDGQVQTKSVTGMSGYTLIKADSIEVAMGIAQSCPYLQVGGTLEVAELIPMRGPQR
ncbi:MAG: hypothetical protein D6698_13715 [Gammaproteobacteria bacterium]|nr:MAG: hypothetical protein D6698_13715 [Gammaproteobacteria bacterium]